MIQEPAIAFSRNAPWRDEAAEQSPPPEFAALERAGVPPGPLYCALDEARRTGVAPWDALLAGGALDEFALIRSFARAVGVDVCSAEDLVGPPIDADTFSEAMRTGLLFVRHADGALRLIVAARGEALNRLAILRQREARTFGVAIASPRHFADIAVARGREALAARAAEGPAAVAPELTVSSLPTVGVWTRATLAAASVMILASMWFVKSLGLAALAGLGMLFAALNAFRLWLAITPPTDQRRHRPLADADLPIFTVMVALFREAAVVPDLLDALERLDYPRAKLDIKILTEEGDRETLDALERRRPRAGIEVIRMPAGKPQTKPRALNAGLMAARGELLCVYDAEDRPDPDQLRRAVSAFRRGGPDLACVQAKLAIDNLGDGWIARHFAIEYAALFDVVLPALSTLRLPIPLGGTSNHFRAAVLRQIGGWDAANVTEDADLGLRLARLGWRTETIHSTTWEEATASFWPWIKQRTRWMKGFMMTALVHGRRPTSLARSLDPLSYVTSQLLIGGVALTALAYPVVFALILWRGFDGSLLAQSSSAHELALAGFGVANMIVGFSAGLACGWMGIDRRLPSSMALHLCSLPLYWLLVGAAAWRALWQIVFADATHWEKTAHGVSRNRRTPLKT